MIRSVGLCEHTQVAETDWNHRRILSSHFLIRTLVQFLLSDSVSTSVVMLARLCSCFETYQCLCGPWQNQSKTHEGFLQTQTSSRYHSPWSCTCTDLSSHSVYLNFTYSCICINLFFVNTLSKCESQIAQEYERNISEVCKSSKRIRTSRWPKRRAGECWWAKSGLSLW